MGALALRPVPWPEGAGVSGGWQGGEGGVSGWGRAEQAQVVGQD